MLQATPKPEEIKDIKKLDILFLVTLGLGIISAIFIAAFWVDIKWIKQIWSVPTMKFRISIS